jgi:hypothetical protein
LVERVLVSRDRSWATETAVLQIAFDSGLDRNTIRVRFIRDVVNGQTQFLCLPSGRSCFSGLLSGLFCIVPNPLILSGAVANTNKVGAVFGRFGAAAYCERSISLGCAFDLLPKIDSLDCHSNFLVARLCKTLQLPQKL